MSRPSSSIILAVALFAAISMLSGCLSTPDYETCSQYVSASDREYCFYHAAVLNQQPDNCYYIPNMTARETCLEEANDANAQARLQDSSYNRQQYVSDAQPQQTPAQPQGEAPQVPPSGDPVSLCMNAKQLSKDACIRQVAIERNDLLMCGTVSAGDFRASCISNIALNLKTKAPCDKLTRDSDRQICYYYAQS